MSNETVRHKYTLEIRGETLGTHMSSADDAKIIAHYHSLKECNKDAFVTLLQDDNIIIAVFRNGEVYLKAPF